MAEWYLVQGQDFNDLQKAIDHAEDLAKNGLWNGPVHVWKRVATVAARYEVKRYA